MRENVLALSSAIVAAVGVAVSVFPTIRDRASVKVFARPDDAALDDFRDSSEKGNKYLVIALNRGRRTVAIQRIWYQRKSTGEVQHLLTDRHDQGTQLLEEGRSLHWELDVRNVPPNDLKDIVLEAQDGRRWKGAYDKKAKRLEWNK